MEKESNRSHFPEKSILDCTEPTRTDGRTDTTLAIVLIDTRRWPVPAGGNSFVVVAGIPKKGRGPAAPFGQSGMLEKKIENYFGPLPAWCRGNHAKIFNRRAHGLGMWYVLYMYDNDVTLVIRPYWESYLPETLYNMLQLHNMLGLHIILLWRGEIWRADLVQF